MSAAAGKWSSLAAKGKTRWQSFGKAEASLTFFFTNQLNYA